MQHIKIYLPCNFEVNPIYPFWPIMQIRKKGGWNKKKNLLLWNYWANLNQTLLKWSLGGPLSKCVRQRRPVSKMAAITKNRNFFKWPKLLYLSQKVPKVELYKHNDELFSMYDRIFYELWTFVDFDRLCKLEKRGDEI